MKKTMVILSLIIAVAAVICFKVLSPQRYETSFYDVFDTYSTLTIYTDSSKKAQEAADGVHDELVRLNRLYDRYNNYKGVNNLKTVNDNAGIAPVMVDKELMELLKFSADAYAATDGTVNPAMGGVLKIWHNHREEALENPENASLPSIEELKLADEHTDMSALVLDSEKGTAYIADKNMSLDVGAVAKGFAADKAIEYLKENGIDCAMLNLGGNVSVTGTPRRGKLWNIGVKNPEDNYGSSAVVSITDRSVVTSGDYQRYFEVEGKRYNHIIDGKTLMPAQRYTSVTIVADSSAAADMLSTALFILPEKEGDALASKYNAKVCRIYSDGTIAADDIFETGG